MAGAGHLLGPPPGLCGDTHQGLLMRPGLPHNMARSQGGASWESRWKLYLFYDLSLGNHSIASVDWSGHKPTCDRGEKTRTPPPSAECRGKGRCCWALFLSGLEDVFSTDLWKCVTVEMFLAALSASELFAFRPTQTWI